MSLQLQIGMVVVLLVVWAATFLAGFGIGENLTRRRMIERTNGPNELKIVRRLLGL